MKNKILFFLEVIFKNKFIRRFLQLACSLVILIIIFNKTDIKAVIEDLQSVHLSTVFLTVIYLFFIIVITSYRWSLLVIDKPKLKDLIVFLKASYWGIFFNLFIPSSIGSDVIKWMPLKKEYPEIKSTKLAFFVLIDRVIGLLALLFISYFSILFAKINSSNIPVPDSIFMVFTVFTILLIIFFLLYLFTDAIKVINRFPILKSIDFKILFINKMKFIVCFIISLVSQGLWITSFYIYSRIFNVDINLAVFFVYMPIVSFAMLIPISFLGIGVRESTFLYFFSYLNIQDEKLLLIAAYGSAISILNSLLGGLINLFLHIKSKVFK